MVNTDNFIEENNSYNVLDESPKFEGFNSEVEEIDIVDFLGVDNILSNYLDDSGFNQFYVVNGNSMFKIEKIVDPFWEIFMAREIKKISKVRVKIALSQLVVKNFQDDSKGVLFLSICYIMSLLKIKGLISHMKDQEPS